jgi:hypothetical protein
MAIDLADFESKTKKAVKQFWSSRQNALQQQLDTGTADRGMRGAVTSGKNMDGFSTLMEQIVKLNGLENATIIKNGRLMTLPGFFRLQKTTSYEVVFCFARTSLLGLALKGATTGNRTQIPGTTNRSNSRYTIIAIFGWF